MNNRPYIEVSVVFLSSNEGGRINPPLLNGYPPHFRVINDIEYLGIKFIEEVNEVVIPGEPKKTKASLIYYPDYDVSYGKLKPGAEFEILEGSKVVGKGIVLSEVKTE